MWPTRNSLTTLLFCSSHNLMHSFLQGWMWYVECRYSNQSFEDPLGYIREHFVWTTRYHTSPPPLVFYVVSSKASEFALSEHRTAVWLSPQRSRIYFSCKRGKMSMGKNITNKEHTFNDEQNNVDSISLLDIIPYHQKIHLWHICVFYAELSFKYWAS